MIERFTFRFVFVSAICLFQRHSMNSLQRLVNLLQWHQKRMRCFLRFFTFSQSIHHQKMNLLHTTIREQMTWRTEKQKSTWICHAINSVRFFRSRLFAFMRQYSINSFFLFESAVNQSRPINKNSKSSNSRSLRQYMFAKSISFCCFCFCFRFVLKYRSFHHINLQIFSRSRFSTKFSFSSHIFIFLLLAHFLFSNLSLYVYRICYEIFSVNHDQTDIWIIVNEFLRNVDR